MSLERRDLSATGLPRSLTDVSELVTLPVGNGVPALVSQPRGDGRAQLLVWMHGRTVDKFLDPGRYNRLVRAGIATCAIDLPGHGERVSLLGEAPAHDPSRSLDVIEQAVGEIDGVVRAIADEFGDRIDTSRLAIGGMSLGGMVTLRRLCEPHSFACASVEATSGNLAGLYFDDDGPRAGWPVVHERADVARVDPMEHVDGFTPVPLLVLHSEADEMVPWSVQRRFLDAVRPRYDAAGARLDVRTWPETGAPGEHVGFGRVSNEAKTLQTAFLAEYLTGGTGA